MTVELPRCKGEIFEKLTSEGYIIEDEKESAEVRKKYKRMCRKIQQAQIDNTNERQEALPPCYYCQPVVFSYCEQTGSECKEFELWVSNPVHLDIANGKRVNLGRL